jgi:hypothetical protein
MRRLGGHSAWRHALETGARIGHEALARLVQKPGPYPAGVLLRLAERTIPFSDAMGGDKPIFDHDMARTVLDAKSSCISDT